MSHHAEKDALRATGRKLPWRCRRGWHRVEVNRCVRCGANLGIVRGPGRHPRVLPSTKIEEDA